MIHTPLRLPESTTERLSQFQRKVVVVKLAEGMFAAVFGLVLSYVAVFVLDRFFDTSRLVRAFLLTLGSLGLAVYFPVMCHRWVWQTRRMEQVARLIRRRFHSLGDDLLGVIELARDPGQAGSSHSLAQAAITHVDQRVRDRDFTEALPHPRHRLWGRLACVPIVISLTALLIVPAAGVNALKRWIAPWQQTDRYTFTQLEDLSPNIIVPHGEEFSVPAILKPDTVWKPASALAVVDRVRSVPAELADHTYRFQLPALTSAAHVDFRIGDARESIRIQPELRPEIVAADAHVKLPEYLQRTSGLVKDVRGGSVSVVRGSEVAVAATISRELQHAHVTTAPRLPPGEITSSAVTSSEITSSDVTSGEAIHNQGHVVTVCTSERLIAGHFVRIDSPMDMEIAWRDTLGLTSREPFRLKIQAVEDSPPVISCQQREPEQVILTTDVITFELSAADDFGVQRMGLDWHGMADAQESPETGYQVETGSKLAAAGSPDQEKLRATVTFCADSDNVTPQLLELRAWAEDYNPDGQRTYSPSYVLHIMRPSEHAVWIANQLRRWASRADDVYEEEMRLHATNRELRSVDITQLGQPDMQQTIAQQIAAERANAARLSSVTDQGRILIEQALRNQEMQVAHLETWAAALLNLEKISQQQMPSVAQLLSTAASASQQANARQASNEPREDPSSQAATVGNNRGNLQASPDDKADSPQDDSDAAEDDSKKAPRIEDVESGFQPPDQNPDSEEDSSDKDEDKDKKQKSNPGRLGLPETVLQGGPKPPKSTRKQLPEDEQAADSLDEAVQIQESLLLEFERIRDDLQSIMDDLENSTFVKRLKAASRRQLEIAHDLNRTLSQSFGIDYRQLEEPRTAMLESIAQREQNHSQLIWNIQSDMEAYMSRVPDPTSLRIIDEMKTMTAVNSIAAVGDRIRENMAGESISRSEFWADVLDRWAEELVPIPPASDGDKSKDQNKTQGSLPPALVLEIMRVLKGEIDLREETRSLEQARSILDIHQYSEKALQQATQQGSLADRTGDVMQQIRELPEGGAAFENELVILSEALHAMTDARSILSIPDTGPDAIAAETEAIECLLRAKRSQPQDASGKSTGGATPGIGTEGTTDQAALALLGSSSDASAKIQQRGVSQATGNTDTALPEEFREGLDAFFNAVDGGR